MTLFADVSVALEAFGSAQSLNFDSPETYLSDFANETESRRGSIVWKWECRQTFREPDNSSWEAFERGEEGRAFSILDNAEHELITAVHNLPYSLRRVRVVRLPLTAYLQWELRVIAQRTSGGEQARIIDATSTQLRKLVELPEIIVLDNDLAYEILYDSTGTLVGARKFHDVTLVAAARSAIENAFEKAVLLDRFLVAIE